MPTIPAYRPGHYVPPELLGLLLVEMAVSFGLAYALFATGPIQAGWEAPALRNAMLASIVVGFTSFLVGVYRPELYRRTRALLLSTAMGGIVACPVVWLIGEALAKDTPWLVTDPSWPAKVLVVWIAALLGLRLCVLAAVRSKLLVRPVAVLCPHIEVAAATAAMRGGRAGFLEIVRPSAGAGPAALRDAGVHMALTSTRHLAELSPDTLAAYARAGVEILDEPSFWERHLKRIDIDQVSPAWLAQLDAPRPALDRIVTRTGDIVTSLALLLFTLPLMLLVSLLVRLDSPGPVLYRQERVGLGGRRFVLLKFRSMNANAEARGPAWAQQRDPRVTRVGSFMRRTRIDELPQLLNVLRGEMSFIGPRPERPHFVEQLAEIVPHYRDRARVKPGLTGWAQVNYPYGASVEDARAKLSYDLYYVRHRSLLLDLLILVSTVRVILFQEGAR